MLLTAEPVLAAPPSAKAVSSAAESGATAAAPSLPVIDPMETVRERLRDKLRPPPPPSDGSGGATDESDAMDRLRERLAERLGMNKVDANSAHPNELRLTMRAAPAPAKPGKSSSPGGSVAAKVAPPAAVRLQSLPWSYQGEAGPQSWAQLKPEYALCGNGKRQSPVDLREGIQVNLDPLVFDYRPSSFRVVDDGRGVSAQIGGGSSLQLRGQRYELVQALFHTPGEDQVQGKTFDMSVQLLHKDAQGNWLIVSVLIERGGLQPVVQSVLDNLPLEKGEGLAAVEPLDWSQLLPPDRRYFIYMGSLSTPPCTEGVVRIVLKTPVTVSAEQLAIFSRLYPMNARPLQALSGRMVKESN